MPALAAATFVLICTLIGVLIGHPVPGLLVGLVLVAVAYAPTLRRR
jgi:putative effector of murein hydrolase LrgA (UPF0299 family)